MARDPELTNERAEQEWAWIVGQVGEQKALDAIQLLGNRKPFPLNISRVLGLQLPPTAELEPTPAMRERAESVRRDSISRLAEVRARISAQLRD